MRVHIGTDHAGFELKEQLVKHLEEKGYEVEDRCSRARHSGRLSSLLPGGR